MKLVLAVSPLILIVPSVPLQTVGFMRESVIIGFAITVKEVVVFEHPVRASVKVKVTLPAATPSTTPALETVAFETSLEAHVPPVIGVKLVVPPTQIEVEAAVTVGKVLTVTLEVVLLHPVDV